MEKPKTIKKVYIIRKYILASSAGEAIRKEKQHGVDDCWAEEKSLNSFIERLTPKPEEKPMGFNVEKK